MRSPPGERYELPAIQGQLLIPVSRFQNIENLIYIRPFRVSHHHKTKTFIRVNPQASYRLLLTSHSSNPPSPVSLADTKTHAGADKGAIAKLASFPEEIFFHLSRNHIFPIHQTVAVLR